MLPKNRVDSRSIKSIKKGGIPKSKQKDTSLVTASASGGAEIRVGEKDNNWGGWTKWEKAVLQVQD